MAYIHRPEVDHFFRLDRVPYVTIMIFLLLLIGCATLKAPDPAEPGIATSLLPAPVSCRFYAPTGWDGVTPLPLVIMLHDHSENSLIFEKHGIISSLMAMMESGAIPLAILAAPESEKGFWWNYYDGSHRYADFIVRDLIPEAARRYPIRKDTKNLHVFGIGTGAMGAVELSYLYPGVFGTVGAINGHYFDDVGAVEYAEQNPFSKFDMVFGPTHNQRAMQAHSVYHGIQTAADVSGTRFVIGSSALESWKLNESNELLRQHFFLLGIPHDTVVFYGSDKKDNGQSMIPVFVALQLGVGDTYGEVNGNPYHVLKSR